MKVKYVGNAKVTLIRGEVYEVNEKTLSSDNKPWDEGYTLKNVQFPNFKYAQSYFEIVEEDVKMHDSIKKLIDYLKTMKEYTQFSYKNTIMTGDVVQYDDNIYKVIIGAADNGYMYVVDVKRDYSNAWTASPSRFYFSTPTTAKFISNDAVVFITDLVNEDAKKQAKVIELSDIIKKLENDLLNAQKELKEIA